jgi:tetratricopeptide (TPR) repeat protein
MDPRLADHGEHPTPADRLDSWKEIAAYLRRDVRTVQRWHDRAGLPVHRHADAKQRGVFAFRGELDGWANESRTAAEAESPPVHPPESRRRWPRVASWAAGGVSLLVVVSLALGWGREKSDPPTSATDRAWVLVAAFDNRTGDDALDDSLQFLVERELTAYPAIRVLPRPRVQDVLRLMRRPAETPLTPEVAREVALRDGDVRAIVLGRVDRGSQYLLTLDIVDPRTGATVASRSTDVKSRASVLDDVRRLTMWARDALAHSDTPPASDVRMPQVTTTSLRALQLYTRAQDALFQQHRHAAGVLLESAIREDPQFALAHSWLALVLRSQPDAASSTTAQEHEDRALALATQTTERERLHITGMYQLGHEQPEKALATWEALARIDPDNWLAHQYMSVLYYGLRRIPEALREAEKVAELRPHDFRIAVFTAQSCVLWGGDPNRARPYVERARALWPAQESSFSSEPRISNLPPEHARAAAWVFLFPAYERWRAGDIAGMLSVLRQVLDSKLLPSPVDRDALLTIAIGLTMSAGRLHEARELAESESQDRVRELHLAVLADALDDVPELRRHMRRVPLNGEDRALRFVRAGLYSEAESIMGRVNDSEGYTDTARGELALRRGRVPEAIEALQRGVDRASTHTLSELYLGAESLASALERQNRHDEALKALEAAAAQEPRYTRTGPSGAFWLRVLARLSRAYRERGRTTDAEAVDSRLRRLLAFADPDHPLLVQLTRHVKAN